MGDVKMEAEAIEGTATKATDKSNRYNTLSVRMKAEEVEEIENFISQPGSGYHPGDRSVVVREAIKFYIDMRRFGTASEGENATYVDFIKAAEANNEVPEAIIKSLTRVFKQGGRINLEYGSEETDNSGSYSFRKETPPREL